MAFQCCPQFELRLAVSDSLKENHTSVVIHVRDVNDNSPQFERPTYRTQITEEDDRNLPKRVLKVRHVYNTSLNWFSVRKDIKFNILTRPLRPTATHNPTLVCNYVYFTRDTREKHITVCRFGLVFVQEQCVVCVFL